MLPLRRLPPLPLPRGSTPRRLLATAVSAASPLPWPGLHAWRRAPPSDLRSWGPHGPCSPEADEVGQGLPGAGAGASNGSSLAEMGALVLSTADPLAKARLTHAAFTQFSGGLPVGLATAPDHPARPDKPVVVTQKEITTHKEMGVPLNAYMLHFLAHVELNAIDLAWDTVVRFSPLRDTLGDGFFADFARVADDESRHFRWYSQRLGELGFRYGDMPVHNLLWRECAKSSSDVSARMAVIPLVQVVMLGLDAAGKTTILYKLHIGEVVQVVLGQEINGARVVTLNRPRQLNVISNRVVFILAQLLEKWEKDDDAKLAIFKLESLLAMVAGVYSEDNNMHLEAMMQFRKLLSIERSP